MNSTVGILPDNIVNTLIKNVCGSYIKVQAWLKQLCSHITLAKLFWLQNSTLKFPNEKRNTPLDI